MTKGNLRAQQLCNNSWGGGVGFPGEMQNFIFLLNNLVTCSWCVAANRKLAVITLWLNWEASVRVQLPSDCFCFGGVFLPQWCLWTLKDLISSNISTITLLQLSQSVFLRWAAAPGPSSPGLPAPRTLQPQTAPPRGSHTESSELGWRPYFGGFWLG